jgi:hypothetical protein
VQVEAGHPAHGGAQLLDGRGGVTAGVLGRPGPLADHDPVDAPAERGGGEQAGRGPLDPLRQPAEVGLSQCDLPQPVQLGWRRAGESDAGLLADQAVGAVAADQVAGAQPVAPLRAPDLHGDRVLVLGQPGKLVAAADVGAEFPGPRLQHRLDLGLPGRHRRREVPGGR